jgi:hypothetical protein
MANLSGGGQRGVFRGRSHAVCYEIPDKHARVLATSCGRTTSAKVSRMLKQTLDCGPVANEFTV